MATYSMDNLKKRATSISKLYINSKINNWKTKVIVTFDRVQVEFDFVFPSKIMCM